MEQAIGETLDGSPLPDPNEGKAPAAVAMRAEAIKAGRRDESATSDALERAFQQHADLWWQETRILSSIDAKIFNRHYQRIIGMGRAVLPLIFSALRDRGGQWYWALECITGDNPAKNAETLIEAKRLWLEYGREHGYK